MRDDTTAMRDAGLSAVIPTLNSAGHIGPLLGELAATGIVDRCVVADGGSRDGTCEIAIQAGAKVVAAPRGRGSQLSDGADVAGGDWLLFLHVDSRLGPGFADAVRAFTTNPVNEARAAAFHLAFDDPSPAARRLAAIANWRAGALALPYGDQGLLVSRALYERVGGYRSMPLMEDVDLVRRIGPRRLHMLDATITTSAERYRREGFVRRPLRNVLCLALYYLGVPAGAIVKLYG